MIGTVHLIQHHAPRAAGILMRLSNRLSASRKYMVGPVAAVEMRSTDTFKWVCGVVPDLFSKRHVILLLALASHPEDRAGIYLQAFSAADQHSYGTIIFKRVYGTADLGDTLNNVEGSSPGMLAITEAYLDAHLEKAAPQHWMPRRRTAP